MIEVVHKHICINDDVDSLNQNKSQAKYEAEKKSQDNLKQNKS